MSVHEWLVKPNELQYRLEFYIVVGEIEAAVIFNKGAIVFLDFF